MSFEIYWIAWALLGFGIPEVIALVRKDRGDTLSENVWKWFGIRKGKGRWVWPRRGVLAIGMLWLTIHFLTGGAI
jgi:hypothetical protein